MSQPVHCDKTHEMHDRTDLWKEYSQFCQFGGPLHGKINLARHTRLINNDRNTNSNDNAKAFGSYQNDFGRLILQRVNSENNRFLFQQVRCDEGC